MAPHATAMQVVILTWPPHAPAMQVMILTWPPHAPVMQVEKVMRALHVRRVFLWPRFQQFIQDVLEAAMPEARGTEGGAVGGGRGGRRGGPANAGSAGGSYTRQGGGGGQWGGTHFQHQQLMQEVLEAAIPGKGGEGASGVGPTFSISSLCRKYWRQLYQARGWRGPVGWDPLSASAAYAGSAGGGGGGMGGAVRGREGEGRKMGEGGAWMDGGMAGAVWGREGGRGTPFNHIRVTSFCRGLGFLGLVGFSIVCFVCWGGDWGGEGGTLPAAILPCYSYSHIR